MYVNLYNYKLMSTHVIMSGLKENAQFITA